MIIKEDDIDKALELTKDRSSAIRRRNNEVRYKKKLQRLSKLPYISCGAYYDRQKGRCIRYYRGFMSKYYKRRSSKAVRRFKEPVKSGGGYRRIFDFWWSLW